jgi:hypothetical protein
MIKKNKSTLIRISLLLFVIFIPFSLNSNSEVPDSKYLEISSLSFYQTQTCDFSLFDFWRENIGNEKVIIKADFFSSINCFGKVNGVDYINDSFYVYIGTNLNINLLIQSLFWLLLISFIKIPKDTDFSEKLKEKSSLVGIIITALLFTSQIFTEPKFYNLYNKNIDTSISSENFFILSVFLAYLIILKLSDDIITPRISVVSNYLPFLFLVLGTYSSSNINFYIIYFCLIGTKNFSTKTLTNKYSLLYIALVFFWLFNQNSSNNYFDVDKIRGFANSENSQGSLIFWIIIFYFFVNGLLHVFKKYSSQLDFKVVKNSFLISGSLTVLFGLLGTISSYLNFINFYFFGQNKNGMNTFQSVAGNTWRGFSASAEAIGEFYGVALLVSFYFIFKFKKVTFMEIISIGLILYGLIKTNDAAVLISLLLILTFFLSNELTKSKKGAINLIIFFFLVIIFLLVIAYSFFNPGISKDYDFLSQNLLIESLRNSFYFEDENLFVNNLVDSSNYKDISYLEDYEDVLSKSTRFLLENYISDRNTNYIPNITSVISIGSSLINRTDKWGLFISRYNPNNIEFLFGGGPMQFDKFYNSHKIKFNDGLILPHSSVLDILLFFGLTGIVICIFGSIKLMSKNTSDIKYLFLFYILNLLKSDSMLYVSAFILIIFIAVQCQNHKSNMLNID